MHVIGTAGHVDHGKSTLVKALTGMDPDRFEEEKRRGLTIDLGFAWCTLPSGREIGVVDVPGHERFIRNMLAGVGAVDAALFVVAADEGWMPQSAEHLLVLDFLQVRSGIVALTKSDLVDDDVRAAAREEVLDRVAGSVLEGAPVVAVSAVTGAGLDELKTALDGLLEGVAQAADRGRPRMFVDRSFTITGSGTVVTGTLSGGRLAVSDEVEIMPAGHRARIRTLQTHRHPVDVATPGSRVAANLAGIDRQRVMRGDALVSPGVWKQSDTFAARLRAAGGIPHPVTERGAYQLYFGTAEVPCRLRFLQDERDLAPGGTALAQVFTMRPLPIEPLDRFVIRDMGRWETVAGGVVLDHAPGRIRRGDPDVLERLSERESELGSDPAGRVIAERGLVSMSELGWMSGLTGERLVDAVSRAAENGRAVRLGVWVLGAERAAELAEQAQTALAAHHAGNRLEPGMPREALRSLLGLEPKPFAELVEHWTHQGLVVGEGTYVRLPERGPVLAGKDREEADAALEALRSAGPSPPDPSAIGVGPDLLRALERAGEVVAVTSGIVYPVDVLAGIEESIVGLIASGGPVSVAEVRDAIGTSRKYAVPLLEHLDSTGLTQRSGDRRVLGPRGRRMLQGAGG